MAGDNLSLASSGRLSWRSNSMREALPDVFTRNSARWQAVDDDEEELRWAAIERLPTYDRLRKGVLEKVMSNGKVVRNEVDIAHLGVQDKKILMESILRIVEDDNEKFLERLRNRIDRSPFFTLLVKLISCCLVGRIIENLEPQDEFNFHC